MNGKKNRGWREERKGRIKNPKTGSSREGANRESPFKNPHVAIHLTHSKPSHS